MAMSTLAEIERAAEKLTPAQLEELVQNLTARLTRHEKGPTGTYETRTHVGGLQPLGAFYWPACCRQSLPWFFG